MKERNTFIIKTFELFTTIILYYIVGNQNFFLYVLSLSLYYVFSSCFSHISIKESLKKLNSPEAKEKTFKIILLIITIISLLFLILGIVISDTINTLLDINNILPVFTIMGLSILSKPTIKLLSEYLENIKNNKKSYKLLDLYHILDNIFLLIIAIIFFRIFPIENTISIALLYLSKILSTIIIISLAFFLNKSNKNNIFIKEKSNLNKENIDKTEIKKILTKNSYKSIINIVKNSYYYISIIILYLVLSTRYGYAIEKIQEDITFIYFFALSIINYLIYIINLIIKKETKEYDLSESMYKNFEMLLSLSIIFGITSPLICKLIFNDSSKSIYLMMLNFMAIFISQYDITFENIKNKKIIYISLISGLITKIIFTIPLINSFYRMGYNLIYGDIISNIIGMLLSSIINYLYLKNKLSKKEKYFERILKILYENILLCIILILLQFIIPMNTDNYLKSLGILIIYIIISVLFLNIKNKKRG